MDNMESTIFFGHGFSFDEILLNGKLGGPAAIYSYLEIRVKNLSRQIEQHDTSDFDQKRILLAIQAMKEAQALTQSMTGAKNQLSMAH